MRTRVAAALGMSAGSVRMRARKPWCGRRFLWMVGALHFGAAQTAAHTSGAGPWSASRRRALSPICGKPAKTLSGLEHRVHWRPRVRRTLEGPPRRIGPLQHPELPATRARDHEPCPKTTSGTWDAVVSDAPRSHSKSKSGPRDARLRRRDAIRARTDTSAAGSRRPRPLSQGREARRVAGWRDVDEMDRSAAVGRRSGGARARTDDDAALTTLHLEQSSSATATGSHGARWSRRAARGIQPLPHGPPGSARPTCSTRSANTPRGGRLPSATTVDTFTGLSRAGQEATRARPRALSRRRSMLVDEYVPRREVKTEEEFSTPPRYTSRQPSDQESRARETSRRSRSPRNASKRPSGLRRGRTSRRAGDLESASLDAVGALPRRLIAESRRRVTTRVRAREGALIRVVAYASLPATTQPDSPGAWSLYARPAGAGTLADQNAAPTVDVAPESLIATIAGPRSRSLARWRCTSRAR